MPSMAEITGVDTELNSIFDPAQMSGRRRLLLRGVPSFWTTVAAPVRAFKADGPIGGL